MHTEAIGLIREEIQLLRSHLSQSGTDKPTVARIASLEKSIRLLQQMGPFEVAPKAVIHSLPFPEHSGHFSNFRIVDDNESDERELWTEVAIDGKPIRGIVDDIIILNSEKVEKKKP